MCYWPISTLAPPQVMSEIEGLTDVTLTSRFGSD